MQRYFLSNWSLLMVAFAFFITSCSTPTLTQKRHYGNSMYVKVDKDKKTESIRSIEKTTTTNVRQVVSVPVQEVGQQMAYQMTKPVEKVAKVITKVAAKKSLNSVQAFSNQPDVPVLYAVENNRMQSVSATAQEPESSLLRILVILGLILIIAAIITLALDVIGVAGWLGLLLLGLIVVVIAYLL